MTGTQLSLYARERTRVLLSAGASVKYAMKELEKEGIRPCRQTVWRFWVHYRKYGSIAPLPRSGRSTKLTEIVRELIERAMQSDDETTLKELASMIQAQTGYVISLRTVLKGRRLLGWTPRGAAYCQLIRQQNKDKRLAWAREYLHDDFTDVVWSDETTVQLETHRRFCCRKKGQKPRCKPRPKHPIKLHVWAGISFEGPSKLCIFEGIMNAELYVEILDNCLVPFLQEKYPGGHRFMQDNDPKHTSRRAQAFFATHNINWWRTPPESPDANPIENLWHELKLLEMECLSLEPQLQAIQAAFDLWTELEPPGDKEGEMWSGKDDAVRAKESAERQYQTLLDRVQQAKGAIEFEFTNVQAFHDAFTSFNGWLRETERKIQRDDPLKLEKDELQSGLTHLQGVSADITAHESAYDTLCSKCKELVSGRAQDPEELQRKLDNLQQRWNALQIVDDDIEVIEETIPKVIDFYSTHGGISTNVNDILQKLNELSTSAISMEGIEAKRSSLQELADEAQEQKRELDALLATCDLFETPFDQSTFESNISALQEKLNECDKVADGKKEQLKTLEKKIRPMEDLHNKFKSWMASTEASLGDLSHEQQQLEQGQEISRDTLEHENALKSLEAAVSSVLPLLDDSDQSLLFAEQHTTTTRYHHLVFSCKSYLVACWLEDHKRQLCQMAPTGVLVSPLHDQIKEAQDFQRSVVSYKPEIDHLATLADTCREVPAADISQSAQHPDTHPSDEEQVSARVAEVACSYENLQAMIVARLDMLRSYVPVLQQYESSQWAWTTLLVEWEEKTATFPPPGAVPATIEEQIQELQALQQLLSDHEPELSSLKTESQQLCSGPKAEPDYFHQLQEVFPGDVSASVHAACRPGQDHLEITLSDYDTRLETLRKQLDSSCSELSSQLEKARELEVLKEGLLSWITEAEGKLAALAVTDLSSSSVSVQLQNCQTLLDELAEQRAQKDRVGPLFASITGHLLDDHQDKERLSSQLDDLNLRWSRLAEELSQKHSDLESVLSLAEKYETACQKLLPWVSDALVQVESASSLPSEPEAVEKVKSDIEALKTEFNALAPVCASCIDNSHSLVRMCQEPTQKEKTEAQVRALQTDWEKLGKLFADLQQKLTDALVQTMEFQALANGLGRWMDRMKETLDQLEPIAVRVKLVEAQIEGFKPIQSDISTYASTLEKARHVGGSLVEESESEEGQKIQGRLEALENQFSVLEAAAQARMALMEEALKKASLYEDQCTEFNMWLKDAEGKFGGLAPFTVASQPLTRQVEVIKEFCQEVEVHSPDLNELTSSEQTLLNSDLPTLHSCEQHLSKRGQSQAESGVDDPALPTWMERPGASQVVGVGADLRSRYGELKTGALSASDEASQLLEEVVGFESNYDKFSDWLKEKKGVIDSFDPLAITSDEIKEQLQQVEDLQHDFRNREEALEVVNSVGTALVDCCKDELSKSSCMIKVSDLNDSWGDCLAQLSAREENLKKGLLLAEKYSGLHDSFDRWLTASETQVATPPPTHGDPLLIQRKLEELRVLLEEVTAHRPQLNETVVAGHELEDYTPADRGSLADIGYTALQERYAALNLCVEGHTAELEGALGSVSDLRDQLKQLVGQLEELKGRLKSHHPPRITSTDVEKQLRELAVLERKVEVLQPRLSEAEAKGSDYSATQEASGQTGDTDLPSGADIAVLLSSMERSNAEVKDLLSYWRNLLTASLSTSQQFEEKYQSLEVWVKQTEAELARAETVRGISEGVQQQQQELEELQDTIAAHQASLDSLSSLSQTMIDSASSDDSRAVSYKLSQLQFAFEGLRRGVQRRKAVLEEGYSQASAFSSSLADAMAAIADKSDELQGLGVLGVDIDTVKAQLEEYKEFEVSLTVLKPRIMDVLSSGKQLKDSCSTRDVPHISEQLDTLNSEWSQLYSSGLSRKHQLEDALLQLGRFHEALAELLAWINDCTARVSSARPPGARLQRVEEHLQEMESVQSGIASHEPSVSSLNKAGEKLIASSNAENTAEIQQDLQELNDRWSALKDISDKRHTLLVDALKKAKSFHDNWKAQMGWLSDAEHRAYTEWKPCCLPETTEAELNKHQAFLNEVQSHSEPVEALRVEGGDVKAQAIPEEQVMVDRWVADVIQRYQELNATLEEREAQLQQAKRRANEFDESYQSLKSRLSGYEESQGKQEPIHSEAEIVKQQLEEHKELLHELSSAEAMLDQLDGLGQLLCKDCEHVDRDIILQRLADLRAHWETLHSEALNRQSLLEESLLSLGQFEEAYDKLWAWLQSAIHQLGDADPITGDPDLVSAQLSKHKALQKQLGARLSGRNAVTKAGKTLMKHKTGEDKAILRKKLQDLEQEWERVCQISVERQDQLEQAFKLIGQFRSLLGPLHVWMTKKHPLLDEAEPVHGDVETVTILMERHASFQKEMEVHRKKVDSANAAGLHLISEVLNDSAVTEKDLSELGNMWNSTCQLSDKMQGRLDVAYEAARSFEDGYIDLLAWVDTICLELESLPPPDEDVVVLQQQIDEQKELSQEISTKQPEHDRVVAAGQNLLKLAHPSAVPVLQSKLQELERIWLELRGHSGARSEALASSLLQLHGLQDMLDSLWGWVSEAETTMTESEAFPISDDLETVQRQLAEHEAFQGEMATHQPNMDALNKAGKKRKMTHPHANPELNKKISSLYKRWQKLWWRSSERSRQLNDAITRLKDIALARSFNFDVWRKRFVAWVNQNKLRVTDLFRRFDSNHDGMLTREELMRGLKASGLAMNQIELEKIADHFDRNKDGVIDLSEITAVLGGSKRVRAYVTADMSDSEKIHHEIQHQVSKCACAKKFRVTQVAEGQYRFGDSQKLRLVRILRSTVMVRVGGGWEPLEEFLHKHDPCRASGRTNSDLRSMLGKEPGLATAGFISKTQTAVAAKNAELKREAGRGTEKKLITRTLPSSRKETVVVGHKASASRSREGTPTRSSRLTPSRPAKHTTPTHTASHKTAAAASSSLTTPKTASAASGRKSPSTPRRIIAAPKGPSGTQSPVPPASGLKTPTRGSRIPVPKTKIPTKKS